MRRAVAVLVCCCAATAFPQQAGPKTVARDASYSISGVVVNALTGEPMAGVTVAITPTVSSPPRAMRRPMANRNTGEPNSTHTGPDGAFAFSGLNAGKYMLIASRRGFGQHAYEQHDQFSSAIVVGPEKQSTGIRFRLEPDASLSGNIVDEHNEPVTNAQVILFRRGIQNGKRGVYRDQETNSDDRGYYHFAHLHAGNFYVAVSAMPWYAEGGRSGFTVMRGAAGGGGRVYAGPPTSISENSTLDVAFPLTFYPGVTDSGSAEAINLKPGARDTADFSLTAQPGIHVRVHATDPSQPVIAASMQREAFGNVIFGGTRSTNDGQGVTDIFGLTAGHYLLDIRSGGRNREDGPVLAASRELDVTGDMDINAGNLPAGVNVSGTLQYQGSVPAGDVRVMLQHRGLPQIVLAVDKSGQITSDGPIGPGEYELVLPVPDYQLTQIQVTGAKLDGQTMYVGSNDVHLTLTAAKASAHVRGVAKSADQPFPGAMIVLVPQDMSRPLLYRRDQSDSDGSFELSRIPPGTYTLIALKDAWNLEWSRPEVMKPFLKSGTVVRVAIDGDYDIDTTVQNVGDVR